MLGHFRAKTMNARYGAPCKRCMTYVYVDYNQLQQELKMSYQVANASNLINFPEVIITVFFYSTPAPHDIFET